MVGPSCAGREVSAERCGQSSAATTSASVAADAVRAARTPVRAPSASAARGLARQDEDPAQPDPLRGRDVGPQVVADHRDAPTAGSRSPRSAARSSATAWRNTTGEGLPQDVARRPRSRTRARRRTPPASSVSPFGVSHHGLRCIASELGAAAEMPEGDVEVPVRQVVAGIADDDRRDRSLAVPRRPRPAVSTCWPSHSRRASSAASTNSGRPAWCARGVGGRGRRRR